MKPILSQAHADNNTLHVAVDLKNLPKPTKQPRKAYPYYTLIGRGLPDYIGEQSMNLLEILPDLDPASTWLWWTLVKKVDYKTNIVYLPTSTLTKAEITKLNRAYKTLRTKDMIIRTKKEHYFLNPDALIPPYEYYEDIKLQWGMVVIAKQLNKIP